MFNVIHGVVMVVIFLLECPSHKPFPCSKDDLALQGGTAHVEHLISTFSPCISRGTPDGFAGRTSNAFEKAMARHFQLQQAKSNPAALAAAAQIVITAVTDSHPQLLLRLLQGDPVQQGADKVFLVDSPYLSNPQTAQATDAL